jgi:hypothetical protein
MGYFARVLTKFQIPTPSQKLMRDKKRAQYLPVASLWIDLIRFDCCWVLAVGVNTGDGMGLTASRSMPLPSGFLVLADAAAAALALRLLLLFFFFVLC